MQSSIEFKANNLCIIYDACSEKSTHTGWNYKYSMLNISAHLPAAYYIEQLDDSALRIRRNDISQAGILQVTVSAYSRGID
jgi:hypothetical protein